MSIVLGPFKLDNFLAEGGMGQIWRGVHVPQGVPVAVKVMTSHKALEPRFRRDFWQEVQAMARLNHTGIAMVFDYGVLPDEAEASSEGELLAGSPYIVMEYASGGSLKEGERPKTWSKIKQTLLELLNALGHAHARGLIHRDIKPANILVCTDADARPGLKLTDFGIVHASERQMPSRKLDFTASEREAPTGTPRYMAPEQFRGQWRDYGPWTDLYALGCVAWQLICGQIPFNGLTFMDLAVAHITGELPLFTPKTQVPEGVEGWIRRLLAKRHAQRFQRASDAAQALQRLGWPVSLTVPGDEPSIEPISVDTDPTMVDVELSTPTIRMDHTLDLQPLSDHALPPLPSTPFDIPEHWEVNSPLIPLQLVGAGLGLYGLRDVPLVARWRERDQLWRALRLTWSKPTARVVVLRGPSGTGKGRLARWLCERAHELGAATVLRAAHDPNPGPGHGLGRMIANHHSCVGLEPSALLSRVQNTLKDQGVFDPYEWSAMARLIVGDPDVLLGPTSQNVQFTTPRERYALLLRELTRLGKERPVIVWLDDVQWGLDAIAFAEHLASAETDTPVLVLMTADDEPLRDLPVALQTLGRLTEQQERVSELHVGPLDAGASLALVKHLLGLESALARQVVERMAGKPLFAVRLVGDWVRRGVLEVSSEGFTIASDRALPESMHELWQDHLALALQSQDESARHALELAAVLGQEVSQTELAAACDKASLSFPDALVEALRADALITPTEGGWTFAHDMLRQTLHHTAREAGRLVGFHRICAGILVDLYPHPHAEVLVRRAHHQALSGDLDGALTSMRLAVEDDLATSKYLLARQRLDSYDRLLSLRQVPEVDARRARGLVMRAELNRYLWSMDEAAVHARAALSATDESESAERADAHLILAHVARQKGSMDEAEQHCTTALAIFEQLDDELGMASTLQARAILCRERGEMTEAAQLYQQAIDRFEQVDDRLRAARCLMGLGNLCRQRKDLAHARAFYTEAAESLKEVGNRQEMAHAINGLADLARYQGDLEAAERGYRDAAAALESVGSKGVTVVRLNLGVVLLKQGSIDKATALFTHILEHTPERRFKAIAHTCLLPCLATSATDLRDWDQHFTQARDLLSETSLADPDLADMAQMAGATLQARGDIERARGAFELTMSQWEALGKSERVAEIVRRITALS